MFCVRGPVGCRLLDHVIVDSIRTVVVSNVGIWVA